MNFSKCWLDYKPLAEYEQEWLTLAVQCEGKIVSSAVREYKLAMKEMTASEAALNDSAAWYVSFNPKNQYYQLTNAATGNRMSYDTSAKAFRSTSSTASNYNRNRNCNLNNNCNIKKNI